MAGAGYCIFLLVCGATGCLSASEIQTDDVSTVQSDRALDPVAATKGHIPVVSSSSVTTTTADILSNYFNQTGANINSIWSLLMKLNQNFPVFQIYGTGPVKDDTKKVDKPSIKPSYWTGNVFKDFYKSMWHLIVKVYVALYGQNAINRIDASDVKEEDEDVLCIEKREEDGPVAIQVDVLGQMFKYLTKYIVKRSYTPFTAVKNIFTSLGFINPIEKDFQEQSPNDVVVVDVDPLTTVFTNIQRLFYTYEEIEKKEEETKMLNKLARTYYVDINNLGTQQTSYLDSKNKTCVLKKPMDLWDEIFPYDSKLIWSNVLLVAVWMVVFWAPILPVILSFPSRNGIPDPFDTDDGDNRRDQQHLFYDPYESQYINDDLGNGLHTDSQSQNSKNTHINYEHHSSPDVTTDSRYSIVNQDAGAQAQAAISAVALNNAMIHDNSIHNQEVSSYTHYNEHDIWYNYANPT